MDVRLFIAVPLPDDLKTAVAEKLRELVAFARRQSAEIKWIKPENLHFTLKFLGECTEEQRTLLEQALTPLVQEIPSFEISLGGWGGFPEKGPLRIVWVGVLQGQDAMKDMARRIDEACEPLGFFKEERAFSPHLTVGRVKSGKGVAEMRHYMEIHSPRDPMGSFLVKHVGLIQSVLSSAGPTYSVLQRFELK